jgi:hypothetical protein
VQVPGFLLRRLYVKGSLRNTEEGFQFDLKNSLGSGYAEQVLPLTVDGAEIPVGAAYFVVDGTTIRFADVTAENPITLAMNRTVTIGADAESLPEGKHKLGIGFIVSGMGKMEFDVTDAIGPGSGDEHDGDAADA